MNELMENFYFLFIHVLFYWMVIMKNHENNFGMY
jgi:hypothetical protein